MDRVLETSIRRFGDTKPYDIQVDFMRDMLTSLDGGRIGLFESPTGTGKSMSVLASSLSYLEWKNSGIAPYKPKMLDESSSDDDLLEESVNKRSKLMICTRTHSQIKELVKELKRPMFLREKFDIKNRKLSIVSLASRRHLCINSKYEQLSPAELNNVCKKSCEFYNKGLIKKFSFHLNENALDIEDLCSYGRDHFCCPYFASRGAIKQSDIVLLPYQSLFQAQTRDTLKLDIKNSYIIVDEAHNLIDALNSMYTVTLDRNQIDCVFNLIVKLRASISKREEILADKDQNKKNPSEPQANDRIKEQIKNLQPIISICLQIKNVLSGNSKEHKASRKEIMMMNEFQEICGINSINTFALIDWVNENQISHRLTYREPEEKIVFSSNSVRSFFSFVDLMGNQDSFGRVLLNMEKGELTYMLLNPSSVFGEILSAKSINLIGGTLQPFDDVITQLVFPHERNRIMYHVNDHVIPKENCLALCVENGPSSHLLSFTHTNRCDNTLFDEICFAIHDLAKVVPDGIIVFFPSFDYMNSVYNHLKGLEICTQIEVTKFLLMEPKNSALQKTMDQYKSFIDHKSGSFTGAILFAVMNGKLSEGINFANGYCRLVMIVGMPFADSRDPILSQRMSFFDEMKSKGESSMSGKEFYKATCMRIVNQSIGRSFRHINDFAVAILFDSRYSSFQELIPQWIRRSLHTSHNWKEILEKVNGFYQKKSKL